MTDTLPSDERTLRADARRNRERILESARAVFSEAGAAAQIDDVARRANVGVGTVYRHFPTKEVLLGELIKQRFRMLADNARKALEQPGEPFAVLEGLMRRNAEELHNDAAMQQTLVGLDNQIWDQARPEQQELLGYTAELVARARRTGTIRADASEHDVAMLMCGLCATMSRAIPGFDWRRYLDLVIDALRA